VDSSPSWYTRKKDLVKIEEQDKTLPREKRKMKELEEEMRK